jgi:hypothetical protein
MVLKTQQFKLPRFFLFNLAAGVLFVGTAAYAVRSLFVTEEVPPCSERYVQATVFALRNASGAALTPADLQARLAGRDWGLLDNARIVETPDGPASAALQVRLADAKVARGEAGERPSGMGFTWMPSRLATASAACLGYTFRVPDDFEFGVGGTLPGLFGGREEAAAPGGKAQFSARYRWRDDGKLELRAATVDAPGGLSLAIDPNKLTLPRGRWVRLEQEVVLNRPGASDGVLRVWVDGAMKLESRNLAFRDKDDQSLKGVIADVHYGRPDLSWAPAPKTANLLMSPFDLRWR